MTEPDSGTWKLEMRHIGIGIALVIMLGQLGVTAWARWSLERVISESVAKAVHDHDTDAGAHDNLAALKRIDDKLESIGMRQLDVLERLSAIQAVQHQQEARMGRSQGGVGAK